MRELKDSLAVRPLCFHLTSLISTSLAAGSGSDAVLGRDEVFDGFAFSCVEEAVGIMGIKSGDVGVDGASTYFVSFHSFI
jgi:hypothetical protein